MINFIKNLLKKRREKKLEKLYRKKLEELKKRDPFVYKH